MMGQSAHTQPAKSVPARPDPQTVLIVDDEHANVQNYTAMLERAGYRVIAFDNAASALSALREGTPSDLVVTDYRMPGMNGLEFLEVLRQELPTVPVIMLTAYGDIDTYFKAFSLGLFEYINKPFHEAELIRIVQAALRGPDCTPRKHASRS